MALPGDPDPLARPDAAQPLDKGELQRAKPERAAFARLPRRPIRVVLDGVGGNYNLGAILRLCNGFLVERLVVCGARLDLRKRKLVQSACRAQRWVPWEERASAAEAVAAAREEGHAVVEIPLGGMGNSLNVATAATIVLHRLSDLSDRGGAQVTDD